ncbi:MAG: hypothetical protein GYB55_18700 [Cytophagales bacterium]|uniref:hypothetical protein n=1 Tax=Cyclobacterium marinum TaxID=104 RepID=UPI00031A02B9|nr:hypothetical protein [Cytophagales bacterium]
MRKQSDTWDVVVNNTQFGVKRKANKSLQTIPYQANLKGIKAQYRVKHANLPPNN